MVFKKGVFRLKLVTGARYPFVFHLFSSYKENSFFAQTDVEKRRFFTEINCCNGLKL